MVQLTTLAAIAAYSFYPVYGINLDVKNPDSIKSAASTIAANVVSYYNANNKAYIWWEAGAIADGLIQYEELTGDTKYNYIVVDIIKSQEGPKLDFLTRMNPPPENDVRGLWALTAVTGAGAQPHSSAAARAWLNIADNVFGELILDWDNATCHGGLLQVPGASGRTLKGAAANGAFFDLAARLVYHANDVKHLTVNDIQHLDWATRVFDWTLAVELIDKNKWSVYHLFEGGHNCTLVDRSQWTYDASVYISGAAHLYNVTDGATKAKWRNVLSGLINNMVSEFFPAGIATEFCELNNTCIPEFAEFKGSLARALVSTVRVAPYTSPIILPLLVSSAEAAAKACTKGLNGTSCPLNWNNVPAGNFSAMLGADLSALSYVQALLVNEATKPTTDTLTLGNVTSASGTSGSGPSSTASGTATSSSTHNAGFALSANVASTGFWTGMLGMTAWLMS